jgi:two component transcriptional regulator, luxR family
MLSSRFTEENPSYPLPLSTRVLQRYEPARQQSKAVAVLSNVDRELLRNIGEGLSNSEIVEAMNLFLSTVKSYVSRLLKKLNAWDRAQLVILAYENGVVTR